MIFIFPFNCLKVSKILRNIYTLNFLLSLLVSEETSNCLENCERWKEKCNENRINRRLRPPNLLLLSAKDQQLLLTRNSAAFSADYGPFLPRQSRHSQSPLASPFWAAAARNADSFVPSAADS